MTKTLLKLCLIWAVYALFMAACIVLKAQEPAKPSEPKCLAVKSIGSHAFRNIMLGGIAGALVSKEQYQVVDAVNYPAQAGQKFHGSDLSTIQTSGTKVVILPKRFTPEDVRKACR